MEVKNWSGYPQIKSKVYYFRTAGELRKLLRDHSRFITRGSGLSYGDASLGKHIISTKLYNKIIAFDKKLGIIRAESGTTLDEILKIIVPLGWFLPVTPGTKFITMGGAVAADIHGKNHHKEGSFSQYVTSIRMMMADGIEINCNQFESSELFYSTCGGMGLTGVIMEIELKLKPIESSQIIQKSIVCHNLNTLVSAMKEHHRVTYSVAWIDCMAKGKGMGRGVLMLGEHAKLNELPQSHRNQPFKLHQAPKLRVPINLPSFVLNKYSIRGFNFFYYWMHKLKRKQSIIHYDQFFYPLDFIKDWNKLYGKRGFLQYQFVIPFENGEKVMHKILTKISHSGFGSFLGVIKLLGDQRSSLSFPMNGYTLALDMPIKKDLFDFLDELDQLITEKGGRIYLAKDARTREDIMQMGYPDISGFRAIRNLTGANLKFESLMSKRLKL